MASPLDQFRGGSKVPAAFNDSTPVGTVVQGKVLEVDVRQRVDFKTKEPLFFNDGKPKLQYQITVDTGHVDPAVEDDDGSRRIYVKMDYKSDREALIAAVDKTGDDDVHVGGHFAARYDGYGTDEQGRAANWKVYFYEYRKPSQLAAAAGVSTTNTSASAPAQQIQQQPAATPPPAPAAAPAPPVPSAPDANTIAAVRAMISGNVPDAVISASFPAVSAELLAALRNAA